MKLAVVLAVSKYAGSGLSDLPGCAQDAKLMQTILSAQDGYQEILNLATSTNSAEAKQHLIDFINRYKGSAISELVFYYTGHGVFLNNEYYYLFSDYQQARLRQTALENTELDNLIRTLKPLLTTKIVDACQSGLPYIKDRGEIGLYLKGTQSGFQNCYFLFSSHTDEASYQDNTLSAFTRSIGELVVSRTGIVRHKDIIDYVSDSFALNALQTPFFIVQADFTDHFCKVDASLQEKVAGILARAVQSSVASPVSLSPGADLKSLVQAEAIYYCTREEAVNALERLFIHFSEWRHPAEALDLYNVELNKLLDYSGIPNLLAIGKWLEETPHAFFAEPTKDKVKVRKPTVEALVRSIGALGSMRSRLREDDYEEHVELRTSGVRSTTEMPYAGLLVRATAKYPNLDSTACFIVPFISRTHVLLFTGMVSYVARGWGEEAIAGEVNWRPFEERMKDEAGVSKTLSIVMKEFWDFTVTPVKKRFDLLKDEPGQESTKKPGKEESGEQNNARDKK